MSTAVSYSNGKRNVSRKDAKAQRTRRTGFFNRENRERAKTRKTRSFYRTLPSPSALYLRERGVFGYPLTVGEREGEFFVQHFSIFPRFLDADVPDRIVCWWGFFLMLGKMGVKGKGFCSTESKISTKVFDWHVPDRIGCWRG
jgi:hypothetical protein